MPRGTYVADDLRALIASGGIASEVAIADEQIQPSSFDLTLSAEAYRMPGSVLALAGERMRDLIQGLALDRLDLAAGACLARNQVYLVRLRERFALPEGAEVYTNSKSSTGRIDLATRLVADGSTRYDRVPPGFAGEVWLELTPRSFDIVAQAGDSLNQAIVFRDRQILDQAALRARHAAGPLLFDISGRSVPAETCLHDGRVMMSADLSAPVVGWVAKRSHRPLVLRRIGGHRPEDFFQAVTRPASGYLFLEKDRFYILATAERVLVPADLACEMVPYDPSAGEFRAHYAGFFDPGWGMGGAGGGTPAVLEVRPHEDDLILRHGQPICAMAYERLTRPCPPGDLYGARSNNYATQQGPRLSKHFAG